MNGIILIDKPEGWTSHDVVAKLRGILHERRIGHSGTLDPLATGLLVVFVGRATRAVEFAEADAKEYAAGLRLGVSTDTQDITGNVLKKSSEIPDDEQLKAALCKFTGDIEQIPPMYSAIKVGGKKLYEIARRGENVERKPRKIHIFGIEHIGKNGGDHLLKVSCSKGTYIRTLCNDIGEELGCGACMSSLRRLSAGCFSVSDAHSIEQVQAAADNGCAEEMLIPVDALFSAYDKCIVGKSDVSRLKNGSVIGTRLPNGTYRVYSEEGEFLLLGSARNGKLKTIKSFFEV